MGGNLEQVKHKVIIFQFMCKIKDVLYHVVGSMLHQILNVYSVSFHENKKSNGGFMDNFRHVHDRSEKLNFEAKTWLFREGP